MELTSRKEEREMPGCQGCCFNSGTVIEGKRWTGVKCTSLQHIRAIDGMLLQDHFERFFREKGYVVLSFKDSAECHTPQG